MNSFIFSKREKSQVLKAYFKVAFDELCCFDCSLYIKADVHFDPCFTVCKLDDWHLRKCQELVHNLAMPKLKSQDSLSTYCSFVKEFDGIWARHIVFFQGLLQFLQRGMGPLSEHHQVNVTKDAGEWKQHNFKPFCLSDTHQM